jgi:hypothetical protein
MSNGLVFTQLTQKPFKYDVTSRVTEADIDMARDQKLKDLEVKALKQREKLEIVSADLNIHNFLHLGATTEGGKDAAEQRGSGRPADDH